MRGSVERPLRVAAHSARRAWAARDPRGIVCRRYGLVYFPVPKAGSTTIKTLLATWDGVEAGRHIHTTRFEQVRASRVGALDGVLVFSVVRNPWARLFASYRDKVVDTNERFGAIHPGLRRYNTFTRRQVFRAGMSFEEFARAVVRIPDSLADEHFRSQVRLVGTARRGPVLDEWIDLERMPVDLPKLFAGRGIEVDALPRLNPHTSTDYRAAYSADLRELVGRRYRRDVDAFGFAF